MSWEKRKKSRGRYYSRTFRRGGGVVREYIGSSTDPVVRVIAQLDALNRAEAGAAVAHVRSEQARYQEFEPLLRAVADGVRIALEVIVLSRGIRSRKGALNAVKHNFEKRQGLEETGDEPMTQELFQHLVRRANGGDQEATQKLQQVLRDYPEIWQEIGDLSRHAERSLIDLIAVGNPVLAESVRLKAEELRTSLLAQAIDQTLEQLLIEHIVLGWLDVEFTRIAMIQPQRFKQDVRFWETRHHQAHGRYLAAMSELARVRGLLTPSSDGVCRSDNPIKESAGDVKT